MSNAERTSIGAVVIIAAALGAAIESGLTGSAVLDRCWTAAFAGAIALLAARAGRSSLVWLIAVALATSFPTPWLIAAVLAAVISLVASRIDRPTPSLSALAGAGAVVALLHPASSIPSAIVAVLVVGGSVPLVVSTFRLVPAGRRRSALFATAGVLTLIAVCIVVTALGAFATAPGLRSGVDSAKHGIAATRSGDLTGASDSFAEAGTRFDTVSSDLDALWMQPARLIPVLGANLAAAREVVSDGQQLALAARTSVDAAPYDQIRLTDGALDLVRITSMQQPVAALDAEVTAVQASLAAIDTTWLLPALSTRISEFSGQVDTVAPQLSTASLALETLPALLGADTTRTYLVEFTSESESRFLGGFVGSFALLTADHGRLTLDRSESVGSLNRRLGPDVPYLATRQFKELYDRFHPQSFAQNWTAAPDLPSNAAMAEQLFAHTTGIHVDGVIVIDPFGLASFLKITGPIRVDGIKQQLTAANAAEYLLHGQYLEFAGQVDQRRDLLAAVAQKAFDALRASPRTNYLEVSKALGPAVSQGHIMFTAFDPGAQTLLDRLGLTGRFELPGDASMISFRNSASFANKIDYFLHRGLTIDATIDPHTNRLEADVTIELRNDSPSSGLPAYVIGNENGEPNGTNGMYFSIYTTGTITDSTLDGEPVMLGELPDRGLRVFSKGITILPGATRTLRLHLSDVIPTTASGFRFDLPHQPTVHDDQLRFTVRSTDARLVPRSLSGLPDASVEVADGVLRATATIDADHTLVVPFARP